VLGAGFLVPGAVPGAGCWVPCRVLLACCVLRADGSTPALRIFILSPGLASRPESVDDADAARRCSTSSCKSGNDLGFVPHRRMRANEGCACDVENASDSLAA